MAIRLRNPSYSPPPPLLLKAARRHTVIGALASFLLTFLMVSGFAFYLHYEEVEHRRLQARLHAQNYAQRIQERLQTALTATYVLSSTVKQSGGKVTGFDDLAMEIITAFPMVSAVQLAPNGVIRMIYPMRGNEAALGHDLLKDRDRNREAHKAIVTRQLTMAGPFNLIQGGVGTVARMPVFMDSADQRSFWGFAIVLIRIPSLLDTTNIGELARAGYRYELWRTKPDSDERYVFARQGNGPPDQPVEYTITVPNGRWTLSLAPENGWNDAAEYGKLVSLSLLIAACVAVLQTIGLQSYVRALAQARIAEH